jgi:hypothetical protein
LRGKFQAVILFSKDKKPTLSALNEIGAHYRDVGFAILEAFAVNQVHLLQNGALPGFA